MPVNATCWEATVVASYYDRPSPMVIAPNWNVAPLIAIRSGYQIRATPFTLVAKMMLNIRHA